MFPPLGVGELLEESGFRTQQFAQQILGGSCHAVLCGVEEIVLLLILRGTLRKV